MNLNYKILSKALSNRIIKILPSIIGEQQHGFIKDRFRRDFCRMVSDLNGVNQTRKISRFSINYSYG